MRILILCVVLALGIGCNKKVKKIEPLADPVVVVQPPVVIPDTGTIPFIIPDKPPVVFPAVISDTVYFDFDSDRLTGESIAALSVDQTLVRSGRITYLRLTGGASPEGSELYNYQLSLRRAEAVKKFLGAFGDIKVYIYGKGETDLVTKTESEYWRNRNCIISNK